MADTRRGGGDTDGRPALSGDELFREVEQDAGLAALRADESDEPGVGSSSPSLSDRSVRPAAILDASFQKHVMESAAVHPSSVRLCSLIHCVIGIVAMALGVQRESR
jgi:hypothetical protein